MKIKSIKGWKSIRSIKSYKPKLQLPFGTFDTFPSFDTSLQRGFVALSTVLIISAVTLVVASTVGYLSIGEIQSAFALYKGEEMLHFVEGCMEDALLKARSSSTFGDPVGTPVSITRPEGTCTITVVSKTGSNPVTWTMNATISTTLYKRTVQTVFNRATTGITITSWKEI